MQWLDALTAKALARELPARSEALAVLASTDDELLDVVAAAFRVRQRYFGRRVKLNFLVNIKSGMCPEDCSYCSQRLGSDAGVLKYTWLKPDEVLASAAAGVAAGAKRVCLVASGRGPAERDITRVAEMIGAFKDQHPDVELCACLGLLSQDQAAARGGRRRLQPQPEHGRGALRRHLHHARLPRPGGHRAAGGRGGPVRLLRPDRRDGGERRRPG